MTVDEARKALLDVVDMNASGGGLGHQGVDDTLSAIDALIAAVRAEMTAPVETLAEAVLRQSLPGSMGATVVDYVDGLRARLAQHEESRGGSANGPSIGWYRGALERAEKRAEGKADAEGRLAQAEAEKMSLDAQLAETERQLEGMRAEYRKLQAANAELRKLCGRAALNLANATQLIAADDLDVDQEDVQAAREFVAQLEAAARGAK